MAVVGHTQRSYYKIQGTVCIDAICDDADENQRFEDEGDVMEHADTFYMELFNGQRGTLPNWIDQQWIGSALDDLPSFDGEVL